MKSKLVDAAVSKIRKQAQYEYLKQPRETADQYLERLRVGFRQRLVHDKPDWSFLGLRITYSRPTKPLSDGWSVAWHTWNKGFTLAYRTPILKSETKVAFAEDLAGSIVPYKVTVKDKPSFWQRRFPKHFTFTIAKLCGKWRITRAFDPYMEASLAATPLISAQEWSDLGADPIKIYDSPNDVPK